MNEDYETRSEVLGFATKDEVKKAADNPRTMILDVRSEEELAEASFTRKFVHASCHLTDCSELMSKAEGLFSDKNGEPQSGNFSITLQ
mmetsp:Transcript_49263/g.73314  ORF Transcript_49263/g.73314 Transcript_49263/m.73314 type:complete len:88 (-) Transcript_49263:417-680(-)